jgi:hypothetical protein
MSAQSGERKRQQHTLCSAIMPAAFSASFNLVSVPSTTDICFIGMPTCRRLMLGAGHRPYINYDERRFLRFPSHVGRSGAFASNLLRANFALAVS